MEWHIHHIIPRYRCKELGIDPDRPENLLKCNVKMHQMLHKIRYEEYGDQRDLSAVFLLEGQMEPGKINRGGKGKPKSPEHRRKISEARKKQVAEGIAVPPNRWLNPTNNDNV